MIEIVSWNVNRQNLLSDITGDALLDVALLQEAPRPDANLHLPAVFPDPGGDWRTGGWTHECRTTILQLSHRVILHPRKLRDATDGDVAALGASRSGTLTVVDVYRDAELLFTLASAYANWESSADREDLIFADASAHRILSDLSSVITGRTRGKNSDRVLFAGDFNILHGYGEQGDAYWGRRYQSVFDRAAAMGLVMVGPQAPHGRVAKPRPSELPAGSRDVPTYRHSRQTVQTASRQLDYVFATSGLAERVQVRALNHPDEWGLSDHCRIRISVDI